MGHQGLVKPGILDRRLTYSGYLTVETLRIRLEDGFVVSRHEGIAVIERPLMQLASDLDQCRIVDGKLVTLVYALRYRRPDLFSA